MPLNKETKPNLYLTYSWGNKDVHIFPKDIRRNVNVMTWLEFKLAYFKAAVQHFKPFFFIDTKVSSM